MSIAIIANPLAGRGRGQKVAQAVQELLTNQNIDFEMIFSKYAGHAVELAEQASRKHRIVAALGGDGTAREVLAAVWQTSSAFGVIPGGTGNDYARGLGIPRDIPEALKVLLAGATAPFGVEQDRVFGQLACIGFPVDVIIHVNEHRDGLIKGSAAFLAGVAATIRSLRTYPVRITVDGKTFEKDVVGVFVMNMPYCGGGMQFVPEARYDSGVFHVLIIDRIGREVSIEGRSLPVMLDGDIFSARPLHAKILPQAAQVVVPKAPA